jgi:hypothetical protein
MFNQRRGLKTASNRLRARGLDDSSKSFGALVDRQITAFSGSITRNGGRPLIG